ncbi:MAG TPA: SpoIIE family protein phosphatase [Thermoleophilaceae bacterium]|jgi:PAS domain S-box-containing protein
MPRDAAVVEPAWARWRRGDRAWLAAGIASGTAIAALDLAVGAGEATFIGFLLVAPLIASFGADARDTALAGAYALVLSLGLGAVGGIFGDFDHVSRVGVVVAAGAIAVWIARVRERDRLARRRYATLAEASDLAASTLDPDVMTIQVAQLLAREVGDWCFVFLREDDGPVRQVAAVHVDPERQRAAWELLRRYPLDPDRDEGPAAVLRDGRPRLYESVDERLLASISANERNLGMLRRLGMVSAAVVPLSARGRTFGAVAVATAESGRVLDDDDLQLLTDLGGRVAAAIDNAHLYGNLTEAERDLRHSRDQLQAILDGVGDAVTVQDRTGRLVFANEAAVELLGFDSVEDLLNAPPGSVRARFDMEDEDGNPFPLERLPGRLALAGEASPPPAMVRFRTHGAGGPSRWSRVKASPLFGQSGEPVLAINVIEDVTAEREASESQRLLAEASRLLSSSLDYDTTLANVARLTVPRLADWCAVDVEEDGSVKPVVVAHTDPAKVRWAEQLRERYPPNPTQATGLYEVLRTGRAELYEEIPQEMLEAAARDAEHLELMRQLQMRSGMVVPMIARGRTLGAITMMTTSAESGRTFGESDLRLAEELAARCALAVDNARLFHARAHVARTLQQSFLPPELPRTPGLDVAARFRAAGEAHEVGGDFYDLFATGGSRWAALIGDVCGKGPEAAAVTALARYTLRTAAMSEHVPSRVLTMLNEAMLRQRDDRRFSTVLYATLDRHGDGTRLRFATGGHPLPLLLRANGESCEVGTPGTVLGVVPDPDLVDQEVELHPGDAVVLYTDGVTDAAAPDLVREPAELAAMLGPARGESADAIAERLLELALSVRNGDEPRDDIAILVIRVPA